MGESVGSEVHGSLRYLTFELARVEAFKQFSSLFVGQAWAFSTFLDVVLFFPSTSKRTSDDLNSQRARQPLKRTLTSHHIPFHPITIHYSRTVLVWSFFSIFWILLQFSDSYSIRKEWKRTIWYSIIQLYRMHQIVLFHSFPMLYLSHPMISEVLLSKPHACQGEHPRLPKVETLRFRQINHEVNCDKFHVFHSFSPVKSRCFKWTSPFFPAESPRYSPTGKVGTEGGASSVALLDAVEAMDEATSGDRCGSWGS